ncbi:MAG: PIG-L family deacetylase [Bacillota bacterium]|nr:PIG-L family deacetylase [Bacillota bacterium]
MRITDLVPVPDLLGMRRVLCIQPHPDDMEVGAGATVARLCRAGGRVRVVTVTDGGAGSADPAMSPAELAAVRRGEAEAAARLLGVAEMGWLGFPDGGELEEGAVRRALAREIRAFRPDLLLAPDPWLPYEAHPDHRLTGLAAAAAAILAAFPYALRSGEGPEPRHEVQAVAFYGTAAPNTRVDVGETWALKLEALRAHRSQFPPETWPFVQAYFEGKAREIGAGAGCELAEAFKVLPPIALHFNVDAAAS